MVPRLISKTQQRQATGFNVLNRDLEVVPMISASNAAIWRGPGAQRAIPNLCKVSSQTEAGIGCCIRRSTPSTPNHTPLSTSAPLWLDSFSSIHVQMRKCENAKFKKFENSKMRKCENLKIRKFENSKIQKSKNAKMQKCKNAKM